MPHCRAVASLHVHHVRPRSRGGPLEAWNETTGCEGCHLHVIHAGHAVTEGRAPDGLIVHLGTDAPGPDGSAGRPRETWRDERLLASVERATAPWRARRAGSATELSA